jgi:DNA polymerase V
MEKTPPAKKAICIARSFGKMLSDMEAVSEALANFAAICSHKLRKQKSGATQLTVFLETNPFRENLPQYYKSTMLQLPVATNFSNEIIRYAKEGLRSIYREGYSYKKVGLMVWGLVPENQVQQNLFDEVQRDKFDALMKIMDKLNDSSSTKNLVRSSAQGFDRKWKLRQEKLSPCYTSKWSDLLSAEIS